MKIAALVGLALLIANLKAASRVVVYVQNDGVVSAQVVYEAEYIASRMFARIGVSVEWHEGKRGRETGAIQATIVQSPPAGLLRTALGCARFSAHSHGDILVIANRLKNVGLPLRVSLVLAHVLVHEITHVLEGVSRHSETGIMKADWTFADYGQMFKTLEFDPVDVNMIRDRLAHR